MVRLPLTPAEVERSMLWTALMARVSPETLRKIESGRVATPSFSTVAAESTPASRLASSVALTETG